MFRNTLFLSNTYRHWSTRSLLNTSRVLRLNSKVRFYSTQIPQSNNKDESQSNSKNQYQSNSKNDKSSFRDEAKRLFKLLRPEYKWISFAVFCLILQSTSSMFVPKLTGDLLDLSNKYILKKESNEEGDSTLNYTDSGRMKFELWGLSETQFFTVVGSVLVVGCLSNALRLIILRTTGERIIARLRTRLLNRIFEQDSKFWDVNKTGDILSRLNSDCVVVSRSLTNNISDGARSLFQGSVAVVISRFLGKRAKTISKKVQEKIGEILKINEYQLNNQNLIRNYSAERVELVRYSDSIRNFYKASLKDVMNSALAQSTNQILGTTSLVACLLIGTNMVQQGHLTAGELSSFAMYAIYSASAFAGLFNFYNEINKGIGSYSRVIEIYDKKPSISPYKGTKDIHKVIEKYNLSNKSNNVPIVEFQDVKFSYPSRKEVTIFNHLDFEISKGENICIVGSSGKGKSSLLNLLFRSYDIEKGTIKVYNEDIKNFSLRKYRRHVEIKREKFSEQEIAVAVEKANCTDFIKSFPEGLNTKVSNKSGLSVGQKQRLALARQFLNNPDILFLDESTSALDGVSENIVVSNIQKRSSLEGKTTISIAHRKSTIKYASRIIVLGDDGKVAETGSYDELIARKDSKLNDLLAHNMQNL
ncbi:unnamed protein product [Hanseniaspora opuntiae]